MHQVLSLQLQRRSVRTGHVGGLKAFPNDAELQQQGLSVVANLSAAEGGQELLGKAGACGAVWAAIELHEASEEVSTAAASALMALCIGNDANQARLAALGAGRALGLALRNTKLQPHRHAVLLTAATVSSSA